MYRFLRHQRRCHGSRAVLEEMYKSSLVQWVNLGYDLSFVNRLPMQLVASFPL